MHRLLLVFCIVMTLPASERLAQLGRIWVDVKHFHPQLAYKDLDWENAAVEPIRKARTASSAKDYADAVDAMLTVLEDGGTRVHGSDDVAMDGVPLELRTEEDGVLFATVRAPSALGKALIDEFRTKLTASKGAVIDLRGQNDAALRYLFDYPGSVSSWLISAPLELPGARSRMHSGYGGGGSFFYYSAFQVRTGRSLAPTGQAVTAPVVFLVNRRTTVPLSLYALQAMGRIGIVHEGDGQATPVEETVTYALEEGYTVSLRIDEPLMADGTGMPPPTARVAEGAAVAEALRLIGADSMPKMRGEPLRATPVWRKERWTSSPFPSTEERLLAAFETWGVFEYFFAYRKLMDNDWYATFRDSISKFEAAANAREYFFALCELTAHTQDSHVNVIGRMRTELFGQAVPPLAARFLGEKLVVTAVGDGVTGVGAGDIISAIDGQPIAAKKEELAKWTAASTPQSLAGKLAMAVLQGPAGSDVTLTVERAWGHEDIKLVRESAHWKIGITRAGDAVRLLQDNIGYADLVRLSPAEVDGMFEKFRDTKAIIFDMRGYPKGTAWAIAPRLTDRRSPAAALFRRPLGLGPTGKSADLNMTGTDLWFQQTIPATTQWRYKNPTVMLIDERAVSQSEHSGLFYRTANGTKFIGTPTTGANGDVTAFTVPGGYRISFSGHDVRHLDGTQLQRVGLKPDIEVAPTPEGLRAGRDEVLDRAVVFINTGR